MRPEEFKEGTVFVDSHDIIWVVCRRGNGRTVSAKNKLHEFDSFFVDSEYAEDCNAIFIPYGNLNNQQEEPNKSEIKLILPHYYGTDTPYEPFKIADFYKLNIREFSALKYLLRSKDESKRIEDLNKAITCIHKEIIRLESLKESGN